MALRDLQESKKVLDEERKRFGASKLQMPQSKRSSGIGLHPSSDIPVARQQFVERKPNFSKNSVIPPIQPKTSVDSNGSVPLEDDPRERAIKSVPNVRYRAPARESDSFEPAPAPVKPRSAHAGLPQKAAAKPPRAPVAVEAECLSPEQIFVDPEEAPPPKLDNIRQRAEQRRRSAAGSNPSSASAGRQPHPPPGARKPAQELNTAADAYDVYEKGKKDAERAAQAAQDAEQEQLKKVKGEAAKKKKQEIEDRRRREEERKNQMLERQRQREEQRRRKEEAPGEEEGEQEEEAAGPPARRDPPRQASPPLPAMAARPAATTAVRAAAVAPVAAGRVQAEEGEDEGEDDGEEGEDGEDGEDGQDADNADVGGEPEITPEGVTLRPCPICGRKFAEDRLAKHKTVCEKSKSKKRKAFDPRKHRIISSEMAQFVAQADKTDKFYQKKARKANWRTKHEEFIAAIRAAKGGDDVAPAPPASNPDYVTCDGCGRRFNEDAAARHIPKCMDKSKGKKK